jgi:polysaccharide biosynthesis protein PslE
MPDTPHTTNMPRELLPRESMPREILEMLFRHKKKLILFPCAVLALAALVMLFAPRTYRSEAKLFLQLGRASVGLDPTATTGQTVNYSQSGRDEEVKSAIQIITGSGVLGKVVDRLGADAVMNRGGEGENTAHGPASSWIADTLRAPLQWVGTALQQIDPVSDRERAMHAIYDALSVETERESTVLVLRYDAATPTLAQKILSAIVEVYKEEHSRVHRKHQSLDFFDTQRELLGKQLEESEISLRDAKNSMGIASVAARRENLEAQLKQLQLDQLQAEQEIASAQARSRDIEQQLGEIPERRIASRKSIPNVGTDLLREQLYALQVRQKELLSRYTSDHPQVVAIAEQIQNAEKIVVDETRDREETSEEINPIHQSLTLDLRQQQSLAMGLRSRIEAVTGHIAQLREEVRKLNEFEVHIAQLERETELRRDKFLKYSQNVEEARIDQQLDEQRISDVSVVHDATLSEKPVSPSKLLVLAGTLLLCSAGTGAVIFVADRLDTRLRAGRGLSDTLGLPVLGVIPESARYARLHLKTR